MNNITEVEVQVRRKEEGSDDAQSSKSAFPIHETDSLWEVLQRCGVKADEHVYAWYESEANVADIDAFLEVTFDDRFFVPTDDFFRRLKQDFKGFEGEDAPENMYDDARVIHKRKAAQILRLSKLRVCKGFSDKPLTHVDPFHAKETQPLSDVVLNFNINVRERLSMNPKSCVIHVVCADISQSQDDTIVAKQYLTLNRFPRRTLQVSKKHDEGDEKEKEEDEMTGVEDDFFLESVNIRCKTMKKGADVDLEEIFQFFPMKKNVAFIHYTGRGKNTRINKDYEVDSTVDWMQDYLFGKERELTKNHLYMYVKMSETSFVEIVVHRSGDVYVVYSKRMRSVKHSGRLENLIDILEQLSSSLRLFSDTFFSFRSDVQSIFKHEQILIRSFQTYHTMKFDAKAVALSNTEVRGGLRDKFAANTWPFLAIDDPKSKGGNEHERVQLIYRSCENSAGPALEIFLAMRILSKEAFQRSYSMTKEDVDKFYDQSRKMKKTEEKIFETIVDQKSTRLVHMEVKAKNKSEYEVKASNLFGLNSHSVLKRDVFRALRRKNANHDDNDVNKKPLNADEVFQKIRDDNEAGEGTDDKGESYDDGSDGDDGESDSEDDEDIEKYRKAFDGVGGGASTECRSEVENNFEDLKALDGELFVSQVDAATSGRKKKNLRGYSAKCNYKPIGLNTKQFKAQEEYDEKVGEKSYKYYLKTGSTPEKCEENYYICPRYWCPKSKIAVATKDGRCPDHDNGERPVQHACDTVNPYFLKRDVHKDNLQLPCCGIRLLKENQRSKGCEVSDAEVSEISVSALSSPTRSSLSKLTLTSRLTKKLSKILDANSLFTLKGYVSDEVKISQFLGTSEPILETVAEKYGPSDHIRVRNGYYLRSFFDPDVTMETARGEFEDFLKAHEEFVRSFGLSVSDITSKLKKGAVDDEIAHAMFVIFNSYTNFMTYVRSENPKSFEEILDMIESPICNPARFGVLYVRDSSDRLTIDVERSVLSSGNLKDHGIIVMLDGSPQPIFDSEKSFARVKLPFLLQVLAEHEVVDTVKVVTQKLGVETLRGVTLVVDLNFKVCGCVFEKIYVPFADYLELGPKETPHVFVTTLTLDPGLRVSALKVYEKHMIEYELLPDDGGIYFPSQDMHYRFTTTETDGNEKPAMVPFGFRWSVVRPIRKYDTVCYLANRKETDIDDILLDVYYLRHRLNPMLDAQKIEYMTTKYDISQDLSKCLLRVHDLRSLLDESKSPDAPHNGKESRSIFVNLIEDGTPLRSIMSSVRKSYMRTFLTNMDDHLRYIDDRNVTITFNENKANTNYIDVPGQRGDFKTTSLNADDFSLVTLNMSADQVFRFLHESVLQYNGDPPSITTLREIYERPSETSSEEDSTSFSESDVRDVSSYLKLNYVILGKTGVLRLNEEHSNKNFLKFHETGDGSTFDLIGEVKAGDSNKIKFLFTLTDDEKEKALKESRSASKSKRMTKKTTKNESMDEATSEPKRTKK